MTEPEIDNIPMSSKSAQATDRLSFSESAINSAHTTAPHMGEGRAWRTALLMAVVNGSVALVCVFSMTVFAWRGFVTWAILEGACAVINAAWWGFWVSRLCHRVKRDGLDLGELSLAVAGGDVSLSGSPLQSAQATDRLSFSESTSNSAHTKETTNG